MIISIGCDHGAFALKHRLISHLKKQGHVLLDCGCHSTASCDYPDPCGDAAKAVADGKCERGIVLCTTGIGASIAANKVRGVRCALLTGTWTAKLTRLHNDTNVMALGAGIVGENLALEIVDTWLNTDFSREERHQKRIDKLMRLDQE